LLQYNPMDRPLIAVVGPTGSGKSELALRIAEDWGGEIVNCDSLQVYRFFDIGTAKLAAGERREIRHHLLDIVTPDEVFTAGEYAAMARPVLDRISEGGHVPVVAGGTGFYLRALLDGLFPGPRRDAALRERLTGRERRRAGSLHRILKRLDAASAERIHPNDVPKIVRALEVVLLTRRPLGESFARGRNALSGYRTLKIGLDPPRAELYRKLDARLDRMFESGLLAEVRGILDMGYPPDIKPFESHGYKQALAVLGGELTLSEALESAKLNTRHYAKRQMTWFRREAGVEWFTGFGSDSAMAGAASERAGAFLSGR
jgi:tRNA dimethylallyltransferase